METRETERFPTLHSLDEPPDLLRKICVAGPHQRLSGAVIPRDHRASTPVRRLMRCDIEKR